MTDTDAASSPEAAWVDTFTRGVEAGYQVGRYDLERRVSEANSAGYARALRTYSPRPGTIRVDIRLALLFYFFALIGCIYVGDRLGRHFGLKLHGTTTLGPEREVEE